MSQASAAGSSAAHTRCRCPRSQRMHSRWVIAATAGPGPRATTGSSTSRPAGGSSAGSRCRPTARSRTLRPRSCSATRSGRGPADIVARLSDWSVTVDAVVGRSSSGGITPAESLSRPGRGRRGARGERRRRRGFHGETPSGSWRGQRGTPRGVGYGARPGARHRSGEPCHLHDDGFDLQRGRPRLGPAGSAELLGSDGVHPTTGQEGLWGASWCCSCRRGVTRRRGAALTRCEGDVSNAVHG